MKHTTKVQGAAIPNSAVLGTFEGECADSNITNKNGLDITREVWEHVFDSDEYQEGIKLGHFIGYLGHPDDPGAQDFEHACIVMTEGHIDDDGKVYGKFNLVDTPVGRIVKSFIDAGVTFGISVRGAGDVISNSVDPDTFVFRGFDLVTFPAYPEAIPVFSEIAASSDVETQQKYKRICAAVSDNIEGLDSVDAVETLQACFAKQSDTYKELEQRKHEIESSSKEVYYPDESDVFEEVTAAKIKGLTSLYIESCKEIKRLRAVNAALRKDVVTIKASNTRKLASLKRIMASQVASMDQSISDLGKERANAIEANKLAKVQASRDIKRLKSANAAEIASLKSKINNLETTNLKYKHKIEANSAELDDKAKIIASLQTQVKETVHDRDTAEAQSSNLDARLSELRQQITACQALLRDYQDAYANLYANATGVTISNVAITATTSTSDLRRIIDRAAVTATTEVDSDYTPTDEFDLDVDNSDDSLVVL